MKQIIFLYLLLFTFSSCASYRTRYKQNKEVNEYAELSKDYNYRFYLIGDAGNAPEGNTTAVFRMLKSMLQDESERSSIVWLGDNIYPIGLAPLGHEDRPIGEHRLLKQLECHTDFRGQVFFIPGNHDWYEYGRDGIIRQERFIEEYLEKNMVNSQQKPEIYFLPDSACGQIHTLELGNEINLILLDSNWFLMEDRDQMGDCAYSDRHSFLESLRTKIRSNTDKKLLVCLHHPPYTYGSHGSRFTLKDYIFPLSQMKNGLLVPLPFSGITANLARAYLTPQDARHAAYTVLRQLLDEELQNCDAPVVASGHEHNLQFNPVNGINYIVSGAGSKKSAVGWGKHSEFAAVQNGFVILDYFENHLEINFIIASEKENTPKIIYRKSVTFKIDSEK